MTTIRHDLTDTDVMTLILSGCNANEVAAFAGVSVWAANAMMNRATVGYAVGVLSA